MPPNPKPDELKKCPECGSPVRQIEEGKWECESCNSVWVYARLRIENGILKEVKRCQN